MEFPQGSCLLTTPRFSYGKVSTLPATELPMTVLTFALRTLVIGMACGATATAFAQAQVNEAITALAGRWEISNADHDQSCMLTFKADAGNGGNYKLEFDRAGCAAKFPPLKDVSAWTLTGDSNVRLLDNRGRVIYDFTEVESGMYESLKAGQPLTFLQTAVSAAEAVRTVEQMTGDWSVVRGNAEICVMSLSNAAASPGEMAMQVKPGCDGSVTRFAPTTWQIDHGELVMKSARGQIWRFEDNNGIWERRIPREAEALMLTKR